MCLTLSLFQLLHAVRPPLDPCGAPLSPSAAVDVDRKTVGRYRVWAVEQGLLSGTLPCLGDLNRLLEETMKSSPAPQNVSSVEPYREVIVKLREANVAMMAIY